MMGGKRGRGGQGGGNQERVRTHLFFASQPERTHQKRKRRTHNKLHATSHKKDEMVQAGSSEVDPLQWTGNQRVLHFGPMAQRDPYFYYYPKGWDILYPAQFGFFPYRTSKFRGSASVICCTAFGVFLLIGGSLMCFLGFFVLYDLPFWSWPEENRIRPPPIQVLYYCYARFIHTICTTKLFDFSLHHTRKHEGPSRITTITTHYIPLPPIFDKNPYQPLPPPAYPVLENKYAQSNIVKPHDEKKLYPPVIPGCSTMSLHRKSPNNIFVASPYNTLRATSLSKYQAGILDNSVLENRFGSRQTSVISRQSEVSSQKRSKSMGPLHRTGSNRSSNRSRRQATTADKMVEEQDNEEFGEYSPAAEPAYSDGSESESEDVSPSAVLISPPGRRQHAYDDTFYYEGEFSQESSGQQEYPPPNKRAHREEESSSSATQEPRVLSEPRGPTGRRFYFISVRTIEFAIPEGYDIEEGSIEYLGGGAYGNCIRTNAKCRDGKVRGVAIKKFRDPFVNPTQSRRICREIKLLQLMRHDNIICAMDLYTPDNSEEEFRDIYVVTEFAGRSIYRILRTQNLSREKILNNDHVKFIVYQLLRALKYIHSANIIHRDLKPGNLALTDDSDLTVLDFGLARSLENHESSLTQYVMTRWYRSPEVIYWNIDTYTSKADMWSVGCIAAELLTGEPLFPGDDASMQYARITLLCGSPDKELLDKIERNNSRATRRVVESFKAYKRQSFARYFEPYTPAPGFVEFLEKILVLDPERRMTVEEAIQHPYLREYYLPEDEPVASQAFDLDDSEARSCSQWKTIVWKEIVNFKREQHSPLLSGESPSA
ncbi:unnamed protein product [Caenorhabditis auriculariae]|uniref:mitogen-activated protein kinase n=1 Tax=Caenorhabditis auriculariae TaxID=2777116 RepID=A0A8S1HES5_9PELO|nr:unnamed protein product [Caenorhabditis auriculariae]